MTDQLHLVTLENMHNPRKPGDRFAITSSDRQRLNPSLVTYVAEEPSQRRLDMHRRHYAMLICAMPREVATSYEPLTQGEPK